MSPETQRIAIAKACGYSFKDEGWRYPQEPDWQKYKAVYHGSGLSEGFIGLCRPHWMCIPDYLGNLNDMVKALKILTKDQQALCSEYLCQIRKLDGVGIWNYEDAFVFATATPEEWSEAFLRTLNLWTE